jgi:tRNA1Val (adenine37-N6)-methyltransferase
MITLDYIRDIQVYQNIEGYRFSVDALLLYSFVNTPRASKIIDLGAGSGIIGMLLAKKYENAEVYLVEVQKALVSLSEKNVILNNLQDRVFVIPSDIRELNKKLSSDYLLLSKGYKNLNSLILPENFDIVVSNPPFRKVKSGLISDRDERSIARHELMLSLCDILEAAALLLKHQGRLFMIHLPERLTEIINVLRSYKLEPKRLRFVHSTITSNAKMVLVEIVKGSRSGLKIEKPLIIYNKDKTYTDEMKELYMIK